MNKRATEYDLNNEQFEQLMDKYVMTIVDSMSQEDFRQFVINSYYDDFANYTLSQLLEEIKYTLDDEMLEEFITDIKNDSEDKMQQKALKKHFKCNNKYNIVFYLLLLVD